MLLPGVKSNFHLTTKPTTIQEPLAPPTLPFDGPVLLVYRLVLVGDPGVGEDPARQVSGAGAIDVDEPVLRH